jgi:hypothetical protein
MRRALVVGIPFVVGCYTYAPIEPPAVRPGTGVRVRVSAAGADRLEPLLGTSSARLLSGVLIENRTDTIIVQVPSVVPAEVGTALQTLYQRVSIPRTDLLELETRRLDRFRTTALAGAAALVITAGVIKAVRSDAGKEASPGGGGPGELRAPLPALLRE